MKLNADTKITGDRIVLVPYRKEHVEKYHRWMEDADLREQTASERLSLEDEYTMQQTWLHDDNKCTFIVLDSRMYHSTGFNEVESMIGDVNLFLNNVSEEEEGGDMVEAELSLMIAEPNHRGQGKGTQVALLIIRYGIEELKVDKFVVKISDDNPASLTMFEKLKFSLVSENAVFKEKSLSLTVTSDIRAWVCCSETTPAYELGKTKLNT